MPEPTPITREQLHADDACDPLASLRQRFLLPDGVSYFDGNSLGPVPATVPDRLDDVIDHQWGQALIRAWNDHGWIDLPRRVGAKIAPLIGAAPDQVVVCDSVSVNLFKLLATALALRPDRRTILCQDDHFPTDLYIARGLADWLGDVRLVPVAIDALDEALAEHGDDVAAVSLAHVGYRSGRLHDMARLTRATHDAGALILWDLSHSVGALAVELDACRADLAVGCGYKFLNGGPGAPAFLYVAERHHDAVGFEHANPLAGWLGHRRPFDFSTEYRPAPGVDRYLCGTPPILALAALDAALDSWDGVDLAAVRRKSIRLGQTFLDLTKQRLDGLGLRVACPVDPDRRGSQICLAHDDGYAVMQALIERGVIGDFRAPDILRFGLCPLYTRHVEVWDAVDILRDVLTRGTYREPRYRQRAKVT
ncbi:MAG: kynureninase [Acidobacteriota bacterium]